MDIVSAFDTRQSNFNIRNKFLLLSYQMKARRITVNIMESFATKEHKSVNY